MKNQNTIKNIIEKINIDFDNVLNEIKTLPSAQGIGQTYYNPLWTEKVINNSKKSLK